MIKRNFEQNKILNLREIDIIQFLWSTIINVPSAFTGGKVICVLDI